jgi:hypothetical protein
MTDEQLADIRKWLEQASEPCGNDACIGEWAAVHGMALLDEIERLRGERQWVSVEDAMPPNKEPVFLATFWGGVFEGLWDAAAGEWYMGTTRMPSITHWMPLPEPPEVTP